MGDFAKGQKGKSQVETGRIWRKTDQDGICLIRGHLLQDQSLIDPGGGCHTRKISPLGKGMVSRWRGSWREGRRNRCKKCWGRYRNGSEVGHKLSFCPHGSGE